MTQYSLTNKIYITYKTRIIAESKLRQISKLSNVIIIWYSFLMILASIAELSKLLTIQYFEFISASSSIGIFAASIFLVTGMLEKKADEFRSCYLELQSIYTSDKSEVKKMQLYAAELSRYPNHSSRDHADLILSTWLRGGTLDDATGPVPFTSAVLMMAALRQLVFWVVVASLFIGPLVIAPYLISVVENGV